MKIRFLSLIISVCMLLSVFSAGVYAASTFPDVLSPDHDWAATQIAEMTDMGIIRGYTDGTFKPDKAVNRIEALLLFARAAGIADSSNEKIVEFAYEKYQYLLSDVDFGAYDSYKKEVSFLLYNGVVDEADIVEYLADGAYLEDFPRKDAAKLLTKLCTTKVSSSSKNLEFADLSSIESSYLPYVSYVVGEKLMSGVQKDDGSICFDGDKPLSRAQICILLYNIIKNLTITAEAGTVTEVNTDAGTVDFKNADGNEKSYIVPSDAKVVINGNSSSISEILTKSEIVVVRHGKSIHAVHVFSPRSNRTIKGTVEAALASKTFTKLSVKDEAGEIYTFYTADSFKVTSDGVADSFSSIKTNDYVVVELLGSEIVSIDRQTSEATVQGTLQGINLESPITIDVLTVDETTKKESLATYTVSDSVTIRRNGSSATLREILVGEKVVLTIKRGDVSKIVATTTNSTVSGTIKGINIGAQSSLVISSDSTEKTYQISLDAKFVVGGQDADIYDLRLGNVVNLTLSGTTATKIEQTSASATTTKSGTVESASSAYGYIDLIGSNGVSEKIFAAKTGTSVSAKIIDGETGKEIAFKNITAGDYIIATGAYSNGAFVAKTIIVTKAN